MNQVEVCNMALGWLGAKFITSVDDDTTEAKLCKALWNGTRDAVLEAREWSFAVKRQGPLAADVTEPAYYWSKQFQIPSTTLRVLRCQDTDGESIDWQREGSYVVCDEDALYMITLERVEDVSAWSTLFCHALAARLAADMTVALVDNAALQERMWKLFQVKLHEATVSDAMQGRSIKIQGPGLWKVR